MTIAIQDEASPGSNTYEHLKTIVRALLNSGNEISKAHGPTPIDDLGLFLTQGGWICAPLDPIDFELVARSFELPSTIQIDEEDQSIFCQRSWVIIRGNVG